MPSAPLIAEAQPASPASARDLVRVARHGGSAAELLAALRAAAQDCLAADSAVVTPAAALAVAGPAALVLPFGGADDAGYVLILDRGPAWTPLERLLAGALAGQATLGLALLASEQRRVAQAERDHALARSANTLNFSLELNEVLDALAREADLAVGGGMAGVYLLDADGYGVATAGHNCPEEWFGYRLAPGEGIAGQVLATGSTVLTSAYQEEMTLPREIVMPGVRCGVGVPMCWNGRLRGALSIGFLHERELTRDDLNTLEAIADLAVVACHNAEVHGDVRTAASTDALSGLLNHGAMQTRVREEIFRAVRQGHPLSCVLIDLDDFKRINDDLGHAAGDALLRRVADALRAEIRPYDSAARYGGDEFVLLLPGSDEAAGRQIAERVRLRIAGGGEGPLSTCSIGVAGWEDAMDADQLLAAADRALMLAKRTGKSRVAVANPVAEEQLAALQLSDGSPAAVEALVAAIEARDRYGGEHSASVHALATRVALLLGLPAQSVARIGDAALLHDVGKLAVPNEILGKQGPLDDAEWALMAEHPLVGEQILLRVPRLAAIAPIVRHEHEHWDGSGYPDGLAGHRIPIGSRVILACDAYSAMTATRPYRPALAQTDAVAQLRARAGTQFDPQVVEALLDLLGYG